MHKHAVEICFDRALGHVQIATDFRVVTALEQQIDDLAFPGSQLVEFVFHKIAPSDAPNPATGAETRPSSGSEFGLHCLKLHSRGQSRVPQCYFRKKTAAGAVFPCKTAVAGAMAGTISGGRLCSFAQSLR